MKLWKHIKLNYLKIGQSNIQGFYSLFIYEYVVTFLIDMRKKVICSRNEFQLNIVQHFIHRAPFYLSNVFKEARKGFFVDVVFAKR